MEKFDASWSEYIEIPLETALAKKINTSLETEQRQAFLRRKRRAMRAKK